MVLVQDSPLVQDVSLVPCEFHEKSPAVEESILKRFLTGRIVYRPNGDDSTDQLVVKISDLANPLDGTFDISKWDEAGAYFTISTGYRKAWNPENNNKIEIWIVPKFVVEKNLDGSASHFHSIMNEWTGEIGIFWTWGNWKEMDRFTFCTDRSFYELNHNSGSSCWSWSGHTFAPVISSASITVQEKIFFEFEE